MENDPRNDVSQADAASLKTIMRASMEGSDPNDLAGGIERAKARLTMASDLLDLLSDLGGSEKPEEKPAAKPEQPRKNYRQ